MVGAVAAMIIRVIGTVALLVVCRYEMVLPLETIVLFVCGWYLVLTGLEVHWLSGQAKNLNADTSASSPVAQDALADGTNF
jgi:hypothetical protein